MPKLYKSKKNTSMRSKKTKTHARNTVNKCRKNKTLRGGAVGTGPNNNMMEMKEGAILYNYSDYIKLKKRLDVIDIKLINLDVLSIDATNEKNIIELMNKGEIPLIKTLVIERETIINEIKEINLLYSEYLEKQNNFNKSLLNKIALIAESSL